MMNFDPRVEQSLTLARVVFTNSFMISQLCGGERLSETQVVLRKGRVGQGLKVQHHRHHVHTFILVVFPLLDSLTVQSDRKDERRWMSFLALSSGKQTPEVHISPERSKVKGKQGAPPAAGVGGGKGIEQGHLTRADISACCCGDQTCGPQDSGPSLLAAVLRWKNHELIKLKARCSALWDFLEMWAKPTGTNQRLWLVEGSWEWACPDSHSWNLFRPFKSSNLASSCCCLCFCPLLPYKALCDERVLLCSKWILLHSIALVSCEVLSQYSRLPI